MYAQMANRMDREHGNQGVEVYISDDLKTWKGLESVFVVPDDFWARNMVWAPEVYRNNDKYYLFVAFSNKAHTPADWSALDGNLYVEDGVPYMVFYHEWTQIVDGSMELVQLSDDLSETVGEVVRLFRASEAGWVRPIRNHGYVTDGPFFYKTESGKLLMGWSSFGEKGYAIGQAVSASGSIYGTWEQTDDLIFTEDGGNGRWYKLNTL